jgi:hypothetical protein
MMLRKPVQKSVHKELRIEYTWILIKEYNANEIEAFTDTE